MKHLLAATAIVALALTGQPAPAAVPEDASTLRAVCAAEGKFSETTKLICQNYIGGAVDALKLETPPPFCEPYGIADEQFRVAFLFYVQTHPDEARQSAALLIKRALAAAYPCRKGGAK